MSTCIYMYDWTCFCTPEIDTVTDHTSVKKKVTNSASLKHIGYSVVHIKCPHEKYSAIIQ